MDHHESTVSSICPFPGHTECGVTTYGCYLSKGKIHTY